MFKKAGKQELRTWMLGDTVIFLFMIFLFIYMLASFMNDTKNISSLVFAIIFFLIAVGCVLMFYKMYMAFKTYDERMAEEEQKLLEEEEKRKQEEEERRKQEEEETKRFIEEYQRKVQEAEEARKLAQEANKELSNK